METALPFTNEMPLFMRLEKLAEYSNLSPKQQMQYDDSRLIKFLCTLVLQQTRSNPFNLIF